MNQGIILMHTGIIKAENNIVISDSKYELYVMVPNFSKITLTGR